MAIVSVKKKFGSKRGPLITPDGGRSYSEEWIVLSNIPTERGLAVKNTPGLPKLGNAYAEDGTVVCTKVDPSQDSEQERVWHVAVDYAYQGAEWKSGSAGVTLHPLARPVVMSLGSTHFTESGQKDLDGKEFMDTAGTPFRTTPPIPKSHLVMSFTKNVAAIDTAFLDKYEDAVNSDVFRGHPKQTVRVNDISATQVQEEGFSFFSITYQLEVNFKKWIPLKVENIGPRHREVPFGPAVVNVDKNGVADGSLQFLDGNGFVFPAAAAQARGFSFQVDFRVYEPQPFAALGIG